jgi:hypothetical protein
VTGDARREEDAKDSFQMDKGGGSSAAKIVLLFWSWTESPTGLNLELMDCLGPGGLSSTPIRCYPRLDLLDEPR